jgi:hypothetical protein
MKILRKNQQSLGQLFDFFHFKKNYGYILEPFIYFEAHNYES